MAQMTEDDHYTIEVYPKGRKIRLTFVGNCWENNHELIYNTFLAPLVRRYSDDWMTWDTRINIVYGVYEFTWPPKYLDIKGDG